MRSLRVGRVFVALQIFSSSSSSVSAGRCCCAIAAMTCCASAAIVREPDLERPPCQVHPHGRRFHALFPSWRAATKSPLDEIEKRKLKSSGTSVADANRQASTFLCCGQQLNLCMFEEKRANNCLGQVAARDLSRTKSLFKIDYGASGTRVSLARARKEFAHISSIDSGRLLGASSPPG